MRGKPKFKYGDSVKFTVTIDGVETEFIGTIYIVDAYGTFFDSSDVSYDIMSTFKGRETLFKHISEKYVYV